MDYKKIKTRLQALLYIPFFLLLPAAIFYISIKDFVSLFDEGETIVVNNFLLTGVLTPLFICPILTFSYFLCVHLKQPSIQLQKKLEKMIIILFILSTIVSFLFSSGYGGYLKMNGFTQCKENPGGTLYGMATKYAKSESLCSVSFPKNT